jgi:hypothetical protein
VSQMITDGIDKHWHLDKRVPVALIVAIAVQTATAIWWASSTTIRLSEVEAKQKAIENQDSRIVRLETKMDLIFNSLSDIKTLIQRQ